MTKDEAQRSRWTFYEAVRFALKRPPYACIFTAGRLHPRVMDFIDRIILVKNHLAPGRGVISMPG